jgi:hypothetical protein
MQALNELEGLLTHSWQVAKAFFSLVKLEARLAGLSVYPLLICLSLLLMSLMSLWLFSFVILGFIFMHLLHNPWLAMGCVFFLNALTLGFLIYYVILTLKNMSFEQTRAYLSARLRAPS